MKNYINLIFASFKKNNKTMGFWQFLRKYKISTLKFVLKYWTIMFKAIRHFWWQYIRYIMLLIWRRTLIVWSFLFSSLYTDHIIKWWHYIVEIIITWKEFIILFINNYNLIIKIILGLILISISFLILLFTIKIMIKTYKFLFIYRDIKDFNDDVKSFYENEISEFVKKENQKKNVEILNKELPNFKKQTIKKINQNITGHDSKNKLNFNQKRFYTNISSEKLDEYKKVSILSNFNWINNLTEPSYVQWFYYNLYAKIKNNHNYKTYLTDLRFLSEPNKLITVMNYIEQYDDKTHLIAVYFGILEKDKEEFIKRGFDVSLLDILTQKKIKKTYTFPCTLNYNDYCLENVNKYILSHINKEIIRIFLENIHKPKIGLFMSVNNIFLNNMLSKMSIEDSEIIKNNKIVILGLYNKLLNNKIQKENIIFEKQNIIKNGLLMDFYLNNYIIYDE